MKNLSWGKCFPVAIAGFSFGFYQLLYHPRWPSTEMVVSVLLFFTSLAWSALIFFSLERRHWLRFFYSLLAVLLSIFLVEVIRLFPESLPLQRLIYGCNMLGIAMIEFYLRILRREREETL
jgi:hypothetical protein